MDLNIAIPIYRC